MPAPVGVLTSSGEYAGVHVVVGGEDGGETGRRCGVGDSTYSSLSTSGELSRTFSGDSKGSASLRLFCALVRAAIGGGGKGAGVVTLAGGGSAVEHVSNEMSGDVGGTCWFFFSSHAKRLRLFLRRLDFLTCFFFPGCGVVTFGAPRAARAASLQKKETCSPSPRVSRTTFAHTPRSKHCRYSSRAAVWVMVGRVAGGGDMEGGRAVIL